MVALSRDFEQMSARADSSLWNAQAAVRSGEVLVDALLGNDPVAVADSAMVLLLRTIQYDVFSPSTAAYDALVASGDIELLEDAELKQALTDFFGAFDDLRASEGMVLNGQRDFFNSQSYHSLIGARLMRSVLAGDPGAPAQAVARWADSNELVNGIFNMFVAQSFALDDYLFLRRSIDHIRGLLDPAADAGA